MSDVLNLFPARIAIGKWRDPDTGKDVPVLMSSEFERALGALFRRVGGTTALSNDEIAILTAGPDGAAAAASADSRIAQLEQQIIALQAQIAAMAQTNKRLDDMERGSIYGAQAVVCQQAKRISDLEVLSAAAPVNYLDWTRPGKIGSGTPNTAAFTSVTYSGQLTSTIATGTAPMVIASTTKVANLNVDLLDGADWAAPAAIGSTTPNSATFTSISYSGQLTSTVAIGTAPMIVTSTTKVVNLNVDLLDGSDWAVPASIGSTTPNSAVFTTLRATGAFGCNGAAVQTAAASGGAVATTAATNVSPFGYTTAAQADGIRILLNNIRAALVANGIMS